MANILLISNFYPPLESIATNRIYSFAKYLQEDGHSITVLTIPCENNFKDKLSKVKVVRVSYNGWFKRLNTNKKQNKITHYIACLYNVLLMNILPDEVNGWTKSAIKIARKLVEENSYDIIISSAPPIGPHIVATILKKENPQIKWIADMRDLLWSPNYPFLMRIKINKYLKIFLENCDSVLAVSKPQLEEYRKKTKKQMIFKEIRNGFDFDFFYENKREICKKKNFVITFAGTFYGNINPDNFLKALDLVITINPQINIKVKFIGTTNVVKIKQSLKRYVDFEARKPYNIVIDILKNESDLLLLIIPKGREKGIYTGKLFDYLGCCKPILGLVPNNDVAANLILKTNAGYIAENENIQEIKKKILQAYNDWCEEKRFRFNLKLIKMHHRRNQINILSKLIKNEMWL